MLGAISCAHPLAVLGADGHDVDDLQRGAAEGEAADVRRCAA